jgi:hypothetical protein
MASQPPTKRPKLDSAAIIREAWECYRNFSDAATESDDGRDVNENQDHGPIDELLELIELLEPLEVQPFDLPLTSETMTNLNIKSLLPVLLSVSFVHLANYAISYDIKGAKADGYTHEFLLGFDSPLDYFAQSLKYWPTNPAAMSLSANFDRIRCICRVDEICERYVQAAEYAQSWRKMALEFLEKSEIELDVEGLNVKEWVELLIVNGSLGVECTDEDDEDEKVESEDDGYSFSEIESTAAFMSALLLSTVGKHDEAMQQLTKFTLTHRIHPNVWEMAQSSTNELSVSASQKKDDIILFEPKLYHFEGVHAINTEEQEASNEIDDLSSSEILVNPSLVQNEKYRPRGVLPPNLYRRICKLFAPKAKYWTESDYNERGYYSYFIDLDDSSDGKSVREQPTNVIEDVIVNHLLPLAESTLKENNDSSGESFRITGAEWWCHTRQ